jgi:uncharacterized protein YfaS (alpha-2-macroglobulin family)
MSAIFSTPSLRISGPSGDVCLQELAELSCFWRQFSRTPLDGPVKVGDLIAVHVVIRGKDWKYLMVEDPIPAGTELIESGRALQNAFSYTPNYSGSEFHDDRASFFRTELHGEGQFVYFSESN